MQTQLLLVEFVALVAALLATLSESAELELDMARTYDHINELLKKKLPGQEHDIPANMELIKQLFERETQKPMFKKTNLIIALSQLSALSIMDGEDRCTERADDILKVNDKATEGYGNQLWNPKAIVRRVDDIVHHYFMKHDKDCDLVFPDKFNELYELRGKRDGELVKPIVEPLLLDRLSPAGHNQMDMKLLMEMYPRKMLLQRLAKLRPVEQRDGWQLYKSLKKLMEQDPATTSTKLKTSTDADEAYVRDMVLRHLIDPCHQFVINMAPLMHVNIPHDDDTLERWLSNPELLDYYTVHANYELCRQIADQPDLITSMIQSNVAKYERY